MKKLTKSKIKDLKIVAAILIGIGVFMYYGMTGGFDNKPEIKHETKTELIQKQFSAWDGAHRGLEKVIKKSMNDPDSYEHVETYYKDEGTRIFVSTTFRGKNAFGGIVKNTVTAYVDFDGNVIEILQ